MEGKVEQGLESESERIKELVRNRVVFISWIRFIIRTRYILHIG